MKHLTRSKRDQLALKRAGHTQQVIANIIEVSQSTISRELKRNSSLELRRYTASTAQKKSDKIKKLSYISRPHWHDNKNLLLHVISELEDKKSPDQIVGRMRLQKATNTISHQTIYAYVKKDKEKGGCLYKCLRYQGKKYKWRGFCKKDKTKIPNRKGIELRPEIANKKERVGDWESDLVVSSRKGSGAVATFVERKTMYFQATVVKDKSANEMVRATHNSLSKIPKVFRRTMTHDNGKEISNHEQITKDLKIDVYCARPYKSCDRGLNEWMNRELRRFYPKGTNFSKISQKNLDEVIEWLNNCPRRSLNYRTPKEVFQEKLEIMHFTL